MNIIRKFTGMLVAIAISNIGVVTQTHAAESIWSLDSFYQTINNIDFRADEEVASETVAVAQTNPVTPAKKTKTQTAKRTHVVTATAYSSSVDETDDTPFITAANTYVRDGIIATNLINPETGKRYPFGTAVKIPALYGDKVFVVEDRMNKRYTDRIDLWMPSKKEAFQFGKRNVTIEIVS